MEAGRERERRAHTGSRHPLGMSAHAWPRRVSIYTPRPEAASSHTGSRNPPLVSAQTLLYSKAPAYRAKAPLSVSPQACPEPETPIPVCTTSH